MWLKSFSSLEECAQHLHYLTECYGKWFAEANDKEGDDKALEDSPPLMK